MPPKTLIVLSLMLISAPAAFAHDPAGTPKNYCEAIADWSTHDYGPPATGSVIMNPRDGNVGGDCDSSGTDLGNLGTPCAGFDDPSDPLSFYAGLCDSNILLPTGDFDGHEEFALGGAILAACDFGCGGGVGLGSTGCHGQEAHHAEFTTVTVDDLFLGAGVSFTVAVDTFDITGFNSPCGDRQSDLSTDCIGSCTVPFGAGLDGTYRVFVQGTVGHVDSF